MQSETKTYEQLVEEELEIRNEIADTKSLISEAARRAARTGKYSSPDWFMALEKKLKDAQIDHQTVLRELGERRRARASQISRDGAESVDQKRRFFIQVCKRRLDRKTFQELWDEALRDMESARTADAHTAPEKETKR